MKRKNGFRKALLFVALVFVLGGIFGCASYQDSSAVSPSPEQSEFPQSSEQGVVAVSMEDFEFIPKSIEIKKNETIEWTNNDTVYHTVTFSDFKSELMPQGAKFTHKFTETGKFNYYCSTHPYMTGTVTVK